MLEAFNLDPVSLARNAAVEALNMFSEKVYSRSNFSR